jgi:lysophospholipase L1-like esterase
MPRACETRNVNDTQSGRHASPLSNISRWTGRGRGASRLGTPPDVSLRRVCVRVAATIGSGLLGLTLAVGFGEFLARLLPMGPDTVPLRYRVDAECGYVMLAGQSNASARGLQYTTNSDGFRDRERSVTGTDVRRVVVMGDSVVAGWGVEEAEGVTAVLERRLVEGGRGRWDVWNLGTPGYNTHNEVCLAKRQLPRIRPVTTVLVFHRNDPATSMTRYRISSDGAFLDGEEGALEPLKRHLRRSALYILVASRVAELRFRLSHSPAPVRGSARETPWPATARALTQLCRTADEAGSNLVIAFLPTVGSTPETSAPFVDHIRRVECPNVRIVDLTPVFEGRADLYLDAQHPNAAGHRALADALLPIVLDLSASPVALAPRP